MISPANWAELSAFLKSRGDVSGVSEKPEFRLQCEKFLEMLLMKNEVVNLTAVRDLETAFWKHLADSLVLLGWEPLGRVLDWGSGGGLPGIPLSLARRSLGQEIQVDFLDSVGKKLRCIEEFNGQLGLTQAKYFNERGETALQSGKLWGVETVVMRAVAPAERASTWMSSAVPRWVFLLTPPQIEDWKKEASRLKKKGLNLVRVETYDLPRGHGSRALLEYSK